MNTDDQKLYIVVHHKRDPERPFVNSWLDDDRLEAITTTIQIGRYCQDAWQRRERVYVHRCGWDGIDPVVCCSVFVNHIDSVDQRTKLVTFTDQQLLGAQPPYAPHKGESFYFV